jgi:hypothetical protein
MLLSLTAIGIESQQVFPESKSKEKPDVSSKEAEMASRGRIILGISVAVAAIFILAAIPVFSQSADQSEEFEATALGQGTALGRTFPVTITIQRYSSPEDLTILLDAFNKAGTEGVTNALEKMSSKGHIAITGTIGADLAYVRLWPTPTGRKIRGITNRLIRFGEAWYDGRSMDYTLTAFELDLSDEKGKSTGTLIPACKIRMDKKTNEMEMETLYNPPWKLIGIIDWGRLK